jgi:hypothetical protein
MTKIIAVALNFDGNVISLSPPNRHHNLMWLAHILGLNPNRAEQGFIDECGLFWNRKDAAEEVLSTGQVQSLIAPPNLYSEDLFDGGANLPSYEELRNFLCGN